MSVKTISKDELRRMEGSEGLIIQGCGGSLDEWVDGINDMLTEDDILLDGTRFHDCSTFEHDGSTCLLFPFKDDVKLDVGRLAMWRLQTHGNFGGTWLSDYVPNRLGGFEGEIPDEDFDEDCDEGMGMAVGLTYDSHTAKWYCCVCVSSKNYGG